MMGSSSKSSNHQSDSDESSDQSDSYSSSYSDESSDQSDDHSSISSDDQSDLDDQSYSDSSEDDQTDSDNSSEYSSESSDYSSEYSSESSDYLPIPIVAPKKEITSSEAKYQAKMNEKYGQEDQRICSICFENVKSVVANCGHSYCLNCVNTFKNKNQKCAYCSAKITQTKRFAPKGNYVKFSRLKPKRKII